MPEPPKANKPKELSMELRLLLAFLLMGVVLFVTPYFYSPTPTPTPLPPAEGATQEEPLPPVEAAVEEPPAPELEEVPEAPGTIVAEQEEEIVVETDVYRIVFSNRGAVVRSWVLKDYLDNAGSQLDLVYAPATDTVGFPFSLEFTDGAPATGLNDALFVATRTEESPGVEFEYSDGSVYCRKVFLFDQQSYLTQVSTEVARDGSPVPHLIAWRGGFGDSTVQKPTSLQRSLYYNVSEGRMRKENAGAADDGPVIHTGNYSFAGLEDGYFAAVALPENGAAFEIRTVADTVPLAEGEGTEDHVGAALGGRGENTFPWYVGPKDIDFLRQVDPRLEQIVDFGRYLGIVARPLFLVLRWIHDNWIPNWGWAIVFLTIAINFLTLPLKFTSMKSMRKMQTLQPQIKELNDRYKGIGMRDPRKAKQNEEMMALYKKHGVNPAGGCLPMILQMPFFFAFYRVLRIAIELRGAEWLWVTDLSQPEHLPIHILPIVLVITQFASQKFSPTSPSVDPNQQRMMMLMPLFFGFLFYQMSSGLVVYWLTSNLVGVAQQLVFNRIFAADTTAVEPPAAAKSKKKRSGKSR